MEQKTKKGDFVEIKFTGFANGEIFDSNTDDIKKLNPKAEPYKTIVVIGEGMVVQGLDEALENKEVNKEYEVNVPCKNAFGERKRELIRVLPLKPFTEQKIAPKPGSIFTLDNHLVKILAVSGARVTADFNNPLAGKDLFYKFKITRILTNKDEKEKLSALLQFYLRFLPEFEIKEKEILIKGPKELEFFINSYKDKLKKLLEKDLVFKETQNKNTTPNQ